MARLAGRFRESPSAVPAFGRTYRAGWLRKQRVLPAGAPSNPAVVVAISPVTFSLLAQGLNPGPQSRDLGTVTFLIDAGGYLATRQVLDAAVFSLSPQTLTGSKGAAGPGLSAVLDPVTFTLSVQPLTVPSPISLNLAPVAFTVSGTTIIGLPSSDFTADCFKTYDAVGIREDLAPHRGSGRNLSRQALETAMQQMNDLIEGN